MKKFSLLLCSAVILCSCGNEQVQVNSIAISKNYSNITPSQLLCGDGKQWIAFENAAKENSTNQLQMDKASFDESGRFKITFSEKNIEGYVGGGYITIEGNTAFTKTENGNDIIVLHPLKGVRKINNGNTNTIKVSNTELQSTFANTYQWEKVNFPKMPSENFLVLAKQNTNGKADKNTAVKLRLQ